MKSFKPIFLISIFTTFLFSCQKELKQTTTGPNVILFLIDDFGYADISFEGNTQIQTPGIDRIARNGVHFTNFYQSSGACAPTRASLLTGRYHLETGVWGVHAGRDFMHRDETTIADVLHDAGYSTGAFGKWHNGKTWSYFSWNRGFDVGIHSRLYRYFDTQVIYNNKLINVDGPITDVIGEQVVRFIQENKETPFFAYVPFQSIHEPYNCPPDVFQKYKKAGYTDHVARLYGMIEVLDNNIEKILNTVDQLGLTENTVILFLSDDGPSPGFDLSYSNRRMNPEERAERRRGWARELRAGKGSIWEGGSITPFYIQWKGKIQPGNDYNHLSGVIDIFPTILDICGIKIPENNLPVHGKSLWPILEGENVENWDERMYFDNTNFYLIQRHVINTDRPQMHHISLRYQKYKLIRADNTLYGGSDSVYYELYDLAADPVEKNNIFDDKPDVTALLIPEIETWYDNILKGGRAFNQAVYEIGNWEETTTPINLDAVLDLRGSVQRSEQSAFRFDNWSTIGSAMTFEIDVVEQGAYLVELDYTCDLSNLGSVFHVYTESDTAGVLINDPFSSFSDTLFLRTGRQVLNIELASLGKGSTGVNVMTNLLMHRLPEKKNKSIVRNAGMEMYTAEDNKKTFYQSSATADFMFGRNQGDPLEVKMGEEVNIHLFADNPDQIQQAKLLSGFEEIETVNNTPFNFLITATEIGRNTINVEFISKDGIVNAIHGDILVE